MKKITSFTIHTTAEGQRASFTYSNIDSDGNLTEQNKRAETILTDEDALDAANYLYEFLLDKTPE